MTLTIHLSYLLNISLFGTEPAVPGLVSYGISYTATSIVTGQKSQQFEEMAKLEGAYPAKMVSDINPNNEL